MTTAYQTFTDIELRTLQDFFLRAKEEQHEYAYGKPLLDSDPVYMDRNGYDLLVVTAGQLRNDLRPDFAWHMSEYLSDEDDDA